MFKRIGIKDEDFFVRFLGISFSGIGQLTAANWLVKLRLVGLQPICL